MLLIILLILIIIIAVLNIKIVPQAHAYIVERLGGYHSTWSVGIHIKIPFLIKWLQR